MTSKSNTSEINQPVHNDLDALKESDQKHPKFSQLKEISTLKLLYKYGLIKRKKKYSDAAYAWVALSIARKHDLQTPIWAINAISDMAEKSSNVVPSGVSISKTQIVHAKEDMWLVLALSDYLSKIKKQTSIVIFRQNEPTPKDFENIHKNNIKSVKKHIEHLEKKPSLTLDEKQILKSLKKSIKELSINKDQLFRTIARHHKVSLPKLKKLYYSISRPKKRTAKKSPEFSLYTPFPNPFSA